MKILFTTESYYPIIDGGAVAQHRLVHALRERGHDVRVIAPGPTWRSSISNDNGSLIYRPSSLKLPFYMNGKYPFSPFPLPSVRRIINEFDPDVINACSPYPISLSALAIAKQQDIPCVGSIHILPENMLAPILNTFLYQRVLTYTWSYLIGFYNRVTWATVPTQTGAEMYLARGLRTPVTAISNGVNTAVFHPRSDGGYLHEKLGVPQKPLVLYAGRMSHEKNVDVLIKAIPLVLKELDAHFLFCGSGSLKPKMMELAASLGVSDHTTFINFLSDEDYPVVFSLPDVFVMPGESELQSIVTLEALASGVPVVVADKGAVREFAADGAGLSFHPQDSTHLASQLVKVLGDESLRRSMKEKCVAQSRAHAMSAVAEQFEKIYLGLIKN
jgi:1,2-diacylglycerol 3-alpha-glucosyltransferase